jgi:hypothetical protein
VKPVSPVLPQYISEEVVFAKDQPEYMPLPALRIGDAREGVLLSRWRMTWRERWLALWRGDVYVQVMTFNNPLQPVAVTVEPPSE